MTKLSNAKKSTKAVEINTVDVAADTVAATLSDMNVSEILETLKGNEAEAFETFVGSVGQGEMVNRIALDASDLNASVHSFAGAEIDYSLESTLDSGATVQTEERQTVDPMGQYGDLPVKMAYVFDGMELPMNFIIKASDASVEAAKRANDPKGPKVKVSIKCATTDKVLFVVEPMSGARKVAIISGTRQTSTRAVSSGMSEEAKARIEAERQRKEEERAAKAWDAMVDAAEKDNAKFDKQRDKEIREMAAKLAKAQAKLMRHPKTDSDAYNNFLLLTREIGATCKELNHEHNVRSGLSNANFGWKQIALDMEKKFTYRLIAMGRQCQVAEKKGLSEAMRLIDRDIEIPAGWVDISRF